MGIQLTTKEWRPFNGKRKVCSTNGFGKLGSYIQNNEI